jgi:hypothetical protein
LIGSRYCFLHQDPGSWLVGFLVGVLITGVQTWYQGASPLVSVNCTVPQDGDPSRIDCSVDNHGRAQATDIVVGFNHALPVDTKVAADPELALSIHPVDALPDPHLHEEVARITTAFSVRVPRVSSGDSVRFAVYTDNPDNRRAANQLLKIREVQHKILESFTRALSEKFPKETETWDLSKVWAARLKADSFFMPGKFSYQNGRHPVQLLSEEEERAKAAGDEIYRKFKPRLAQLWQDRPSFVAPVVRVRTNQGEGTYAIYPPDVKTCVIMTVPYNTLLERGTVTLYPPIPTSYDSNVCV